MWWSDHTENTLRWHFTEGAVKPQCWRLPAEFCSHITAARGVAVGGAHQPCFLVSGSRRDSRTLCPRKHSGLLVYGYHGFLQKERQWWQGGNGFSRNGTKIKGEDLISFPHFLPGNTCQDRSEDDTAELWHGKAGQVKSACSPTRLWPGSPTDIPDGGAGVKWLDVKWLDGPFSRHGLATTFNVLWYSKVSPLDCTLSSWTDFPRRTLLVSSCLCLDHSWLHRRVYIPIKMLKYLVLKGKLNTNGEESRVIIFKL